VAAEYQAVSTNHFKNKILQEAIDSTQQHSQYNGLLNGLITYSHFIIFYHGWMKILGILYYFYSLGKFCHTQLLLYPDIYTVQMEDGHRSEGNM
jgi:hypothetical protein